LRSFQLFLLICVLSFSGNLRAGTVIDFAHSQRVDLGTQLEYLEDENGTLALPQVLDPTIARKWRDSTQTVLNFGLNHTIYWLRFTVAKTGVAPKPLVLEVAAPLLDSVHLYVIQNGKLVQENATGDRRPYSERPILHSKFLFPIDLAPSVDTQVIVRIQTETTKQIPMRLWNKEEFLKHDHVESTVFGILYGCLLIISLYHLLIFVSVREAGFFYYAMFVLSALANLSTLNGVTPAFVWPGLTWMNDAALVIEVCSVAIFASLFSQSILVLQQTRPKTAFALRLCVYAACATIIVVPFLPYGIAARMAAFVALAALCANLYAHIVRMLDGYRPAKFLVLGAVPYAVSAGALILGRLGILPDTSAIQTVEHISMVGLVLSYAFTLSYRMNMDRSMREAAQHETADIQQRLLETQIRVNDELDRKVHERTRELEQTNAILREVSRTDGLTGLHNRRHFDETFAVELRRGAREGYPVSLLLLDIDFFKKLNDTHGHQFGDICLQQVAQIVQSCMRRPSDFAARYGGEEFIIILPNTPLQGAVQLAKEIRRAVGATVVADSVVAARMTVSIGVACVCPGSEANADAVLRQADELLYQAKGNGRDRVEWQLESMTHSL
jgi:two-component system, sensor histidine kinase LadS